MKMLYAPPAHRNALSGNGFVLSKSFRSNRISSGKELNADQGEPKSHISSSGSFSRSRICESLALQCRNKRTVLFEGCVRDVSSALRAAVGLRRGLLGASVGEKRFHERPPSGCVGSVEDECDSHSTSPSSSLCDEILLNSEGEGGEEDEEEEEEEEEDNLGRREDEDGLEGGEMQLAEEGSRLWDVNSKSKVALSLAIYLSVAQDHD